MMAQLQGSRTHGNLDLPGLTIDTTLNDEPRAALTSDLADG
jgi:hypothetical protein